MAHQHSEMNFCSDTSWNLLFSLPADVVVTICEQFLTLHSLARLDSALCNRSLRPMYLKLLMRVSVSNFAAFTLTFMLTKVRFKLVLCMRWLMDKSISPRALVVPSFDAGSSYPHFTRPDLLMCLTKLHINDLEQKYFDWFEDLLVHSPNLRELAIYTNFYYPCELLASIADRCHNIEVLHIAQYFDMYADGMSMVLRSCKKLRQVCLYKCRISEETVQVLMTSHVAFLVTVGEDCYRESKTKVENAANIGYCFFFWRNVSQNVVETYFQEHLLRIKRYWFDLFVFDGIEPKYDLVSLLRTVHPELKPPLELYMQDCSHFTVPVFAALLQLPFIQQLTLFKNTTITELVSPSVVYSNKATQLLSFNGFTNLTANSVMHIAASHPNATIHLSDLPHLQDAVLPAKVRVH